MHQIYRILRDNKEKGPFSLEELLQLSLKPHDLIWVEGKSAGWRYPEEIETLKPYLEAGLSTPQIQIIKPILSHPASHSNRNEGSKIAPATTVGVDYNNGTDTEEELTAEKLERKADEIYRRIQAYTEKSAVAQEGVQTKYARSLEDLKQEYADWLHTKKKKNRFVLATPSLRTLITAGIVVMAVLLFYLLKSSESVVAPVGKSEELLVSNSKKQIGEVRSEPPVTRFKNNNLKTSLPIAEKKEQTVDEFIDSINHLLARSEASKNLPYKKKGSSSPSGKSLQSPGISGIQYTEQPSVPVIAENKKPELPPGPAVKMDASFEQNPNNNRVSTVEITFRNNTNDLIKTVAVDVFYYKKGERLFDKETLYFTNIPPRNSITFSRPGNKKAVSAKFQLLPLDTPGN